MYNVLGVWWEGRRLFFRRIARRVDIRLKFKSAEKLGIPFFPRATNIFDLPFNHTQLLGWLQFYDMIYGMDEIERPDDRVMEDDERLDLWWEKYRENLKKRLIEHHKSTGTKNIDYGMPKPARGMVFGGDKK